ncbi:SRPBCC family protein [Cryobacterium melibiosiphilum]|nr:SRPBCC domain-containing protein [Cryobacterium melibiosiphilum]
MIDTTKGFTLVRTYPATPEQIFTAWTDADAISQWWHPRGATTPRDAVAVDPQVGGRYTYTMVNEDTGDRVVTAGIYRELTANERLVFTWGEPDGDPEATPVVTITLEPSSESKSVSAGTRLTFDLRGVEGSAGDGFFYDGWDSALDSLGDYLA